MRLDRESLIGRQPFLTVQNEWTIPAEYIDDWGNHLNEADALKIYQKERINLFSKEQMLRHGVLGVLKEQHPRYHSQVFEGEIVNVITSLYVNGARFYFLHLMLRGGVLVQDNLVEGNLINSDGEPTRISAAFLEDLRRQASTTPISH